MSPGAPQTRGNPPATGRVPLPDLRFFPTFRVLLHEEHDPGRVERLVRRLKEEAVLRNPPLVAALGDGRAVVLDGANRVTALEQLGAPHLLVQVVPYAEPSVVLDRWHHLLVTVPEGFPDRLGEGLPVEATDPDDASRRLARGELVAYVRVGGIAQGVPRAPDLVEDADRLRRLVAAYRGRAVYHRVDSEDFEELTARYGGAQALVAFGRFRKEEILELARNSAKLPAGVTRHIVPGRALRVNLPLEVVLRRGSVEEKNAWLRAWIQQQLREGRVRSYLEPTILFDE
ncbi:MAG: hypothetical protein QN213_10835 [Armatimonadota bacterium]|nr:hypothetical protein [Armatimonadota bacterium]MDR7407228.1 hypothetical protein [Armatimonadota bacterium]MDR7531247.1 hypothetical protein [Armatimonadota bacterium]